MEVKGKGFLKFTKKISDKLTVASLSFAKGKYAPVKIFNDFVGVQDGDLIEFEGWLDYNDYTKKLEICIKEFTRKEFERSETGFNAVQEVTVPDDDLPF